MHPLPAGDEAFQQELAHLGQADQLQPARVLLHDYTGIPAVVDLAAMRTAMQWAGKDPGRINPLIPAHLVIDHSAQVNRFGSEGAFRENLDQEYERNRERFALLRWAQQSFDNFTLVPPGMGICHQINLEYLSRCVQVQQIGERALAIPDTLVGTDSHTTMVNGLGVLGWGVGGIEAEACLLGQPLYIPAPIVVGVHFRNALPPGTTATDLVLTLTQVLRKHGVVNRFVEFCGDGLPVFLRDIWPSPAEVEDVVQVAVRKDMFGREYATIYQGDTTWQQVEAPASATYRWEADSTYIREPPFFAHLSHEPEPLQDITGARVLVSLSDSITTDHITPAGNIPVESSAGRYLIEHGVQRQDFNTYGTRRGNYEILARSTWANIRLRNELANGKEGCWTTHQPSGEVMTIFDAAERYRAEGVPLIALAGKEYGTGSSRDSAVKGPLLLGVKAVIAESYERIHRSNLVSMGILPLQFLPGESRESLGLSGREEFSVRGIATGLAPGQRLAGEARGPEGIKRFTVLARIDNIAEAAYLHHGGVLQMVLRQMLKSD